MSWDVAIVKIRGDFRPITEVEPDDFLPLGDEAAVEAAINSAFSSTQWCGSTWAVYQGPNFEIEFSLSDMASSNSILLHIHGDGDPIPSLLELTGKNGWLAVDCSTGEFIDPKKPSYEGWEGFKELIRRGVNSGAPGES